MILYSGWLFPPQVQMIESTSSTRWASALPLNYIPRSPSPFLFWGSVSWSCPGNLAFCFSCHSPRQVAGITGMHHHVQLKIVYSLEAEEDWTGYVRHTPSTWKFMAHSSQKLFLNPSSTSEKKYNFFLPLHHI